MPRHDLSQMLQRLNSLTVGFSPLFSDLQEIGISYPPHNIYETSPTETIIELAVAGFKKDEIQISVKNRMVLITGSKPDQGTNESYQYKGLAYRAFTKKIQLAEFYEIESAKLEDGILTIKCVQNIPEEEQPKLISIG